MNILHPDVKHGNWTAEEDKHLMEIVSEFGPGNNDMYTSLALNQFERFCVLVQENGLKWLSIWDLEQIVHVGDDGLDCLVLHK